MRTEPSNTHGFQQEHAGLTDLLLSEQIRRGGGLLLVNAYGSQDILQDIRQHAAECGREHDVQVIDPCFSTRPVNRNTYSPILYGTPDEVAARILSTAPSAEPNAGADIYRQACLRGLVTLIGALQRAGLAYHFMDLSILLMNPSALSDLERMVTAAAPESNEARNLSAFIGQFRVSADAGMAGPIDMDKVKGLFGGIGGRLFTFGTRDFGKVMNTYDPDVNLFEAIRNNKIIYVALPTMSAVAAARNFEKILLGDLRSAFSRLRTDVTSERDWPDFPCFFTDHHLLDEMWALGKCERLDDKDARYSVRVSFIDSTEKTDTAPCEPQAGREYPVYTRGLDFLVNAERYLTKGGPVETLPFEEKESPT